MNNVLPLEDRPGTGSGSVLLPINLIGRWATALPLATVLLVTAGFGFNEIFVQWFPNFAFAFILLFAIAAVQWLGPAAAARLQIGCMVLTAGGLAALILMGFVNGEPSSSHPPLFTEPWAVQPHSLVAVLLLFVGFDLAHNHVAGKHEFNLKTLAAGLCTALFMLGSWGWVSINHVAVDKLSATYIPHLIAARNIGGDTGRAIMGVVVIAGSIAAVNALFVSLSQLTDGWIVNRRTWKMNNARRPEIWATLAAVLVGLSMATGMAGTDEIDAHVRAGLILWMIYYGAVHMTAFVTHHRSPEPVPWKKQLSSAVAALLWWLAGGILLFGDPQWSIILKFVSFAGAAAVIAMVARNLYTRRWIAQRKT